ncbi:MAG: hypothetical protein WA441_05145 [Methyloceanibacter sp.]
MAEELTTQLQPPSVPSDPQPDFGSDAAGISAAVEAHRNTYEGPIEQVRADALPDIRDEELGIEKGISIKDAAAAITDKRQAQAEEAAKLQAALRGDEAPDDVQAEARRLLEESYTRGREDAGLSDEELRQRLTDPQARAEAQAMRERAAAAVAHSERLNAEAEAEQRREQMARIANSNPQTFQQDKATLQQLWDRDLRDINPNSAADLERLNQVDPGRAAWALRLLQANQQVEQGYAQHQAHTQFQQAAAVEDQKVTAAHPEIFRDAKTAAAIRNGVAEWMCDQLVTHGVARSPDEAGRWLDWAYNQGGVPAMRTAFGQELILAAYRDAQARKMRSTARPVPPTVQRPGVAGSGISDREYGLKAANAKLDATGSLRAAQQLRAAQLAARRGGR